MRLMFTLREQVTIMNTQAHQHDERFAQKELELLELAMVALQETTGIAGKIIAMQFMKHNTKEARS